MADTTQVTDLLKRITSGITYVDEQIGMLGKLDSDGSVNSNPADGLDIPYVWVRIDDQTQAIRAINMAVTAKIPNLGVRVARDRKTKEWVVLGLAPEIVHSLPEQAPTWNQPDRISDLITELVDLNRLRGLRVKRGSTTFRVVAESGYYYWQGEFRAWLASYDELDISGDVPGGYNTKCPVLIGIDPDTNTLTSYAGDPVLVTTPPTKGKMLTPDLIEAAVQAAPDTIRWIACIPLTSSDTDWSDPFRVTALQYIPIFGTGQYTLVRVDGVDQTQRGAVNFISGTGVIIGGADDAGNNETEVTVAADPSQILDGKVLVTAADTTPKHLEDKMGSASTALTYDVQTLGGGNQILNIDLDQTLINHTNLLNRGTNTHAQIDTHLASTSNPHTTTLEQARTANSTMTGAVIINPSTASDKPLLIKGAASQSANLLEFQNSSAAVLGSVNQIGNVLISPAASTGAPGSGLTFTAAAHTGVNNSEYQDVLLGLNRTVQFTGGGGAIGTQRAVYIRRPTYSAASAQTITTAYLLELEGPPVAAAPNMTITNARTFHVASGVSTFDGQVQVNNLLVMGDGQNISFGTGTGTKIGTGSTQKIGWWDATPVVRSNSWSVTNPSTRKSFDTTTVTLVQLAEAVGTIIDTMKTYGMLGA